MRCTVALWLSLFLGCGGLVPSQPTCGDLLVEGGETCDDGNNDNGDGCRSDCSLERCGDGRLDARFASPSLLRFEYLAANGGLVGENVGLVFTVNGLRIPTPLETPLHSALQCSIQGNLDPSSGVQHFEVKDPSILSTLNATQNTFSVSTKESPSVIFAWAKVIIESPLGTQEIVIADVPPVGSAKEGSADFCSSMMTLDPIDPEDPAGVIPASVTTALNFGEECDDGNQNNGDGCRTDCALERCGDGIVQTALGETCDDANQLPFDNCPFDCNAVTLSLEEARATRTPTDDLALLLRWEANEAGVLHAFLDLLDAKEALLEEDILLDLSSLELRASLQTEATIRVDLAGFFNAPSRAGAAKLRARVQDAALRESAPLVIDLSLEECGDGEQAGVEECDDGNTLPDDGCSANCRLPAITLRHLLPFQTSTGDLVLLVEGNAVEAGLTSIEVDFDDPSTGLSSDTFVVSTVPGSFLASTRVENYFETRPIGPNATVTATVVDAFAKESNALSGRLLSTVCGDGILATFTEECDDGNAASGDGCSDECTNEDGAPSCALSVASVARVDLSGVLFLGVVAVFLYRRRPRYNARR